MFKKFLWVFFEKGSLTLIQFISIVVLGRLLSPDDYGIYGIMMVFIYLSDTIVDSGFGGAFVQKKTIDDIDVNTLFITNVGLGVFLYLLIFISAPFLADYYGIPNLSLYFRVLGLLVIIYALSIVQNAFLLRNLQFKLSAKINLVSCLLSTIICFILAFFGLGIWALIFQVLLQSLFSSLYLWYNNRLKISWVFSKESFWEFWKFGSNLLGANILVTIVNNISNSIIPKIGTLKQSGLYFQASKINSIPVNILSLSIDKSLFPILSRESSLGNLLIKARHLNNIFISFVLPLFPLVSVSSYPLIKIILGNKWVEASSFLTIIIWSGIGLFLQVLYRNVLKSIGNTRDIFYIEIIKSVLTLSIIFISMKYGVLFLVWGVTLSSYVGALVLALFAHFKIGYSIVLQAKDMVKPIVTMFIVYFACIVCFPNKTSYLTLLAIPVGYFFYLFLNFITRNKFITEPLKMAINKISKRESSD